MTAPSAFTLKGGTGDDVFDFSVAGTLTGSLDGAAGQDTLRGNRITDVTLTGSDTSGFAGMGSGELDGGRRHAAGQPDHGRDPDRSGYERLCRDDGGSHGALPASMYVTGTGAGTLTGENVASTWSLDGTPTYSDGTGTLAISGFGTLQGGTAVDTFTVHGAQRVHLKGGAGADVFDLERDPHRYARRRSRQRHAGGQPDHGRDAEHLDGRGL